MFYKSMKASKFFKLCISNESESSLPPETLFDISSEIFRENFKTGIVNRDFGHGIDLVENHANEEKIASQCI